jgi:hypothetical protein
VFHEKTHAAPSSVVWRIKIARYLVYIIFTHPQANHPKSLTTSWVGVDNVIDVAAHCDRRSVGRVTRFVYRSDVDDVTSLYVWIGRWRVHDEHDKTIKHHFAAFVVWTVCDEQVYHQWQGVRTWIRYVSCIINKWEGKIRVLNFPGNFRLRQAIFSRLRCLWRHKL